MYRELKDGLILRSLSEGVVSDGERLGDFYVTVFGETDSPAAAATLPYWTNDLTSDQHPTTTLDDIWVVVDPAKEDMIVSALLLIPQTWRYEEIEFPLGRVELVATHRDYRRRGLIRELMNAAHDRSRELGHLVQGITGIPHYYRRFGYAFTVDLGGKVGLNLDAIPDLKDGQEPEFILRPAELKDVSQLVAWDAYYTNQCLLSVVRDEATWRYELQGRHPEAEFRLNVRIIVDRSGEDVGYIAFTKSVENPTLLVWSYIVGEKSSYLATFNDVMRGVRQFCDEYYSDQGKPIVSRASFDSGITPTLETMAQKMTSGVVRSTVYAWYIRVEDLAGFIRLIAPVLERRLSGSGANCYSGTLKVAFYDMTGLTMQFEKGTITDVTVSEMLDSDAMAAYPYHYFLSLVFGHRTVDELRRIMPDAWANREATVLLNALFPVKRSWLMALA